ncbi:MAG: DUF4198 domain-containing protein [Planctomycetota bacterium]|nr:MAG: DUF4198 domain-containing protein [Planctomycetota bacterium]REJ95541.1 MAG: DUF4198 domain-containing protein [Planctomycetota bacterium]REK21927.1 MAG: DUF4198 domain-containing protein [Planctomycetota bacterium]REK32161.1 MAG: DUF4198 domain-containing protein [Planctomycetota bacterium]
MCNQRLTRSFSAVVLLFFPVMAAQAHYLWVDVDPDDGKHGTANLYFEEGPAPGDGGYLDPFVERGRMWVRTLETGDPADLEMTEATAPKKRWLQAPLPQSTSRSVESYGKFGVYRYGETDVLLHYYAKCLQVADHDELHELGRAEELELDIVPHDVSGGVELTVLWRGEPAPDRPVSVRGPGGLKQNLKTDEDGRVEIAVEKPGRYTFRTSVEEPDKSGVDDDGKEYDLTRHHSTLVIELPLGAIE